MIRVLSSAMSIHDSKPTDAAVATARAHANFALVKYWGKRNSELNLPDVGSISITLDALHTTTRVTLDQNLQRDELWLNGQRSPAAELRARQVLDRIREAAGVSSCCRIDSENNFPTAAGLASSASGFAALVTAATAAMRYDTPESKRSEWARMGSGSAARSIFGGFSEMAKGRLDDGTDSVARPLLDAAAWPLEVVVAITRREQKGVSSTEGMLRTAQTSPFYKAWVKHQDQDLDLARDAIAAQDFDALADVAEASALSMHGLAMSARPGLLYFNPTTLACLHRVRELRAEGTPVFFTVDAGPQVKAICMPDHRHQVSTALSEISGVTEVISSVLGPAAHLIDTV